MLRTSGLAGKIQQGAILGLVLLSIFVPLALASDDPGEGQEAQVPGPPTALEMQEGLNAQNSTVYEADVTNLQAAEELPHQDLDRAEALDLLVGVFDPLLRAPAGVFDELDVERFLSANSAIIAPGDQPESNGVTIGSPPADRYEGATLLESTIPLRDEGDTGKPEVVDLGLEPAGDGTLAPSNPLVALSLPQRLGDGIELPESDITVKLDSAPDQLSPSTLEQGAAAYPEVAQDTTFAVAPAPGGFETFTLLQSQEAPTSQTFTLDLPAGASLEATPDGGAEVARNGKPIMGVTPPTAVDAAGENVPATMTVSYNALTLEVTPQATTDFPVLIDPLYETYNWWNGITGLGGWHGYTNASPSYYFADKATCTSYASPYACGSGVTANAPGLYIAELPGAVPVNSQVNWQFEVPRWNEEWTKNSRAPASFISNLTYRNVGFWHRTDSASSPTLWMGIWNSLTPGWVAGYAVGGNSQNILGNGEFEFGPGGSTAGKQASFAVSNTDGHNLTAVRDAFVNTAIVTIADTEAPNLAPAIGPSNWVNQVPTEPISVTATDLGLGVYRLKVAPEGPPPASPWPTQSNNCTGNTVWPCSGSATFTLTKHGSDTGETRDYDPSVMPQGVDNVLLTAEDPLGNKSETRKVKVWVDHDAPTLELSGNLTEQASVGTKLSKYTLNYTAKDGDEAAAAANTTIGAGLDRPQGIAVDSSGNTWVADKNLNRLVMYDKSGTFVRQLYGPTEAPIKEPRGIEVAPNGNLWVAELTNKRLRQFTPTGGVVSTISNASFVEPFGVASAPGSLLWVTDPGAKKVFQFKEDGTLIRTMSGVGNGALNGTDVPFGIDVDENGNAWIAMQGSNRILEINSAGEAKFSIGSSGSEQGQLSAPQDIAVAVSGNIFVSDGLNNRIQEFKPDGTFLRKFGSTGVTNAQFVEPRGLDVAPGNQLVIADAGNHRIDRWTHVDMDPQSGAAKVEVKVDGTLKATNAPGCPTQTATQSCVIGSSWTLNADEYTVGTHKVEVIATDAVGISSPPATLNVETHGDRTAPTVALTGSITEQATLGKTLPSYKVKVAATDPGPAEERKSGVASIVIKVDGKVVDSTSPGCPAEGCSLNREWTLKSSSLTAAGHSLEVVVTDAAGKSKTTSQGFEIKRDTTAPELNLSGALAEAPDGWVQDGTRSLTTDATDAGGYGVKQTRFQIDGQVVGESLTQTCELGGCAKSKTFWIDMTAFGGGAHEGVAIAEDLAGNIRKKTWTINIDPLGQISYSEAVDTLEASDDTAGSAIVASAGEVITPLEKADGNDPTIGQVGETLVVTGVPTETVIPADPTAPITVPTPEGSLQFDPLGGAGGSAPTIASGAAIVTPNTSAAVDTVVRPIYDGFMSFANIRDSSAPETYSWRVVMGKGQALKQIDSQTAVVAYPEDGTTASMIRAEPAHDATGKEVTTSLAVEGTDVVTLTVQHKAPGLVYPVVGGPRFEVGYVVVRAVIPPEPVPGEPEEEEALSEYWESAPEPASGAEAQLGEPFLARLNGQGEHRHFRWIQCHPIDDVAGDAPLKRPGGKCGNPFAGEEGSDEMAFSYGIRGDYYMKRGEWAKHLGSATDHIECAKKNMVDHWDSGVVVEADYFVDPAQQCKWYGPTKDGGGSFVEYGKHLTPYGEWNWGIGSQANHIWYIHQAGLAMYIWVNYTGHIGRHKTTCIDCS